MYVYKYVCTFYMYIQIGYLVIFNTEVVHFLIMILA